MDAAKVGDRSVNAPAAELDPARDALWVSPYNEPDLWANNLAECYYYPTGEYDVEVGVKLYRFELDESRRCELRDGAPRFVCVEICDSAVSPKLGTPPPVTHCPTCGKPI